MLFDKLASFIEKNHPDFIKDFQNVALFDFPYRAHDAITADMFTQDDLDNFYLPFPSVAVEDKATCTVIFDTEDKQTGLDKSRKFIDILAFDCKDPEAFRYRVEEDLSEVRQMAKEEKLHQIVFGRLLNVDLPDEKPPGQENKQYRIEGNIDLVVVANDRGEVKMALGREQLDHDPLAREGFMGVLGNVVTAVEELLLSSKDQKLFVFEKSPTKQRPVKKGRILRSHDRPQYVMLEPNAIRKVMGVKVPTENEPGKRRPHERRRHWRTLRSEKFKKKRGERILIDAQWIGVSEAVVGKKRYKVRLDI